MKLLGVVAAIALCFPITALASDPYEDHGKIRDKFVRTHSLSPQAKRPASRDKVVEELLRSLLHTYPYLERKVKEIQVEIAELTTHEGELRLGKVRERNIGVHTKRHSTKKVPHLKWKISAKMKYDSIDWIAVLEKNMGPVRLSWENDTVTEFSDPGKQEWNTGVKMQLRW